MLTYTGIHITREFGAPSVRDLAVHLMRLCRYGGACSTFWPVGMHSLVVADMLEDAIKPYGTLHDGIEAIMADIPQPFKTDDYRTLSDHKERQMFLSLGLLPMSDEVHKIVKEADIRSLKAEMWLIGPRGGRAYVETHGGRDKKAEELMSKYLAEFEPSQCVDPDGYWVREFEHRLQVQLFNAQKGPYAAKKA